VENIAPEAEKTGKDYKEFLNPESLVPLKGCMLEPSVARAKPGDRFQFERQGYFCADPKDWAEKTFVFNRTVTLRDSWAKIEKASGLSRQPKKAPKVKEQ
jgi:glutaminyl-tRNA synthetase